MYLIKKTISKIYKKAPTTQELKDTPQRHTEGQKVHEKMLGISTHQRNANQKGHREVPLWLRG